MKAKKLIYIAGPVQGVKHYYKAFEKAQDALTSRGYAVLNPVSLPEGIKRSQRVIIGTALLGQADAVLFLPGWENDADAFMEFVFASQMSKPVFHNIDSLTQELKEAQDE